MRGEYDTLLHEDVSGNSSYAKWTEMMLARVRPRLDKAVDVWQAVDRVRRDGIAKGYILFRYDRNERGWHQLGEIDESANVATALAGILGGVAVSEGFEEKAKAIGLSMLMDVRDKTEAWCLEEYGDQFTTTAVMTSDPKSRMARASAVAVRAMVTSQPGPTYEAALARCDPDSIVIGWGTGGEDSNTRPSSEYGLFQTATNWCHNLPTYSTESPESFGESLRRPARSWADIEWESGVHYAAFMMSDGDNIQWLMGNFAGGGEGRSYYESPARGAFPFGWTLCYEGLANVCPYTLVDIFDRATAGDDFVLYGGGYMYPDLFGAKRDVDVTALHASRMGEYMRLGGLRMVAFNAIDWDGEAAREAYNTWAREVPEIDGILTVQYYPYSGGEGRILWTEANGRSVPVISCRLTIWANTGRPRDATPAAVAQWINDLPTGGSTWSDDNFTYVMPHCWSYFRDTDGDLSPTAEEEANDAGAEGVERGLIPVQWCVDRLENNVRVVTPHELALQTRLHLRTREVLAEYLAELRPQVDASASRRAKELVTEADERLGGVTDGDDSGRRAFRLLQRAERLVREG